MFDTEKFIEEIQKRSAIYDVTRSEYSDRNAKMAAWAEVCQVMVPNWTRLTDEDRNLQERNLRGKWRNIRDYFIKEIKLQKSQKSGGEGKRRKKYMYFDKLMFLMPTVDYKRHVSSALANHCKSEESDGEMDNPVIEEYDVPLDLGPQAISSAEYIQAGGSIKVCSNYQKQYYETPYTSFDSEFHDYMSSHSSQRANADEEDYDKMFLLSLLPIVRQIPEDKKLDVRIQMQQVLALALRSTDN
ncbi:uncharacterized protein [Prorops nasuta]|uniref:uncharacterized protein n=1 Tax=Prorops nasuta TaxID=863751 RepID=UPI0034CD571B